MSKTSALSVSQAERRWFRIEAPHFTAGIWIDGDGFVRGGAPIVKYMNGKSFVWVVDYCECKGWKVEPDA